MVGHRSWKESHGGKGVFFYSKTRCIYTTNVDFLDSSSIFPYIELGYDVVLFYEYIDSFRKSAAQKFPKGGVLREKRGFTFDLGWFLYTPERPNGTWNLRFFTCLKFGKVIWTKPPFFLGFKMKKNQGSSGGIFPQCFRWDTHLSLWSVWMGWISKSRWWYFWWFPVKVNGTWLISTISNNL